MTRADLHWETGKVEYSRLKSCANLPFRPLLVSEWHPSNSSCSSALGPQERERVYLWLDKSNIVTSRARKFTCYSVTFDSIWFHYSQRYPLPAMILPTENRSLHCRRGGEHEQCELLRRQRPAETVSPLFQSVLGNERKVHPTSRCLWSPTCLTWCKPLVLMEFSGSHSQHPPVGISKCYGKTSSVVLQVRSPDQQQQQHVVRTSDSWAPPQTYVPGRVWVGPALCFNKPSEQFWCR